MINTLTGKKKSLVKFSEKPEAKLSDGTTITSRTLITFSKVALPQAIKPLLC